MQFTIIALAAAGTLAAPLVQRDINGATLSADRLLESDHSLIELGKRDDELVGAQVSADRLVDSNHDLVAVLERDVNAQVSAERLVDSNHDLLGLSSRGVVDAEVSADRLVDSNHDLLSRDVNAQLSAERLVDSNHDLVSVSSRDINGASISADRLLEADHSLIDVLSTRDLTGSSLSADRLLESDQSIVNVDRLFEDQESVVDASNLINFNLNKRQLSISKDVVPAAKDVLNVSKDVSSLAALTTATIPSLSVPTFAALSTSVSLPLTTALPTLPTSSLGFQNLALTLSTFSSLPSLSIPLESALPTLSTLALPTGVSNNVIENNSGSSVNKLVAGSEDSTTTIDKTLNGKQTITSTKNTTGSFEPITLTSGDQALTIGKGSVSNVETDSVSDSGFLTQQIKQEDKQTAPSLETTTDANGLIADIPNVKRDSTLQHIKAEIKSFTSTATAIPTLVTSYIASSDIAAITSFANKVVATMSAELSTEVAPAQSLVTPLATAVSPAQSAAVKQVERISADVSKLTTISAVAPLATAATL